MAVPSSPSTIKSSELGVPHLSRDIPPADVSVQQLADIATSLNMFELHSSQLLIKRLKKEDVIAWAKQTIAGRTAAGGVIMDAAHQEGIAPSPIVQEQHQRMLEELGSRVS